MPTPLSLSQPKQTFMKNLFSTNILLGFGSKGIKIGALAFTMFFLGFANDSKAQCSFPFDNQLGCDVDVSMTITCGSTIYTFHGTIVGGTTNNVVQTSGPPSSCDFSACDVTLTISGIGGTQILPDAINAGGQVGFTPCGTGGGGAVPLYVVFDGLGFTTTL